MIIKPGLSNKFIKIINKKMSILFNSQSMLVNLLIKKLPIFIKKYHYSKGMIVLVPWLHILQLISLTINKPWNSLINISKKIEGLVNCKFPLLKMLSKKSLIISVIIYFLSNVSYKTSNLNLKSLKNLKGWKAKDMDLTNLY